MTKSHNQPWFCFNQADVAGLVKDDFILDAAELRCTQLDMKRFSIAKQQQIDDLRLVTLV